MQCTLQYMNIILKRLGKELFILAKYKFNIMIKKDNLKPRSRLLLVVRAHSSRSNDSPPLLHTAWYFNIKKQSIDLK